MTDETKLHIAVSRAARAKQVIENELFREAFKLLEAEYIKAMVGSQPHESRMRENLYTAIQILGDVQKHFGQIMSNGNLAQTEIMQLAERGKGKAA